jgi:hypothetical protein
VIFIVYFCVLNVIIKIKIKIKNMIIKIALDLGKQMLVHTVSSVICL